MMPGNFYDVWVCEECENEISDPPSPPSKCKCGGQFELDEEKSSGLPEDWVES